MKWISFGLQWQICTPFSTALHNFIKTNYSIINCVVIQKIHDNLSHFQNLPQKPVSSVPHVFCTLGHKNRLAECKMKNIKDYRKVILKVIQFIWFWLFNACKIDCFYTVIGLFTQYYSQNICQRKLSVKIPSQRPKMLGILKLVERCS